MKENEIFMAVFGYFAKKYPNHKLEIRHKVYGDMVTINGNELYNLKGYGLLYNLKRLINCLENEVK